MVIFYNKKLKKLPDSLKNSSEPLKRSLHLQLLRCTMHEGVGFFEAGKSISSKPFIMQDGEKMFTVAKIGFHLLAPNQCLSSENYTDHAEPEATAYACAIVDKLRENF
jgi:hypothetical protein